MAAPLLLIGLAVLLGAVALSGKSKPSSPSLQPGSSGSLTFDCATKIADAIIANPALSELLEVTGASHDLINPQVKAQLQACSDAGNGNLSQCRGLLQSALAQFLDASTPQVLRLIADAAQQHAPQAGIHGCIRAIADKKDGK